MVLVRCHSSFLCLPVRYGLLLVALFSLFAGGLVSTGSWLQISQLTNYPLVSLDETALYIQAIVYTLLVVVSFYGLIGTLLRRHQMITIYKFLLAFHLVQGLGSSVFSIYTFFRFDPEAVRECLNGSDDEFMKQVCGKGWSTVKAITIGIFAALWLAEAYGIVIADNYAEQVYVDDAAMIPESLSVKSRGSFV